MNILEARRRTLAAEVYKKTAEGNPISVRSLARMRPGLKLFGRSEQFTTTGAQLLNIPDDYTGETKGVTWSANGGVIHVSGTAISDVFTTNVDITDLIEPEQDYYISNNAASESIHAYLEVHYTDETPNDYIQNNIYTAKPNIEKVIFYIHVAPGVTVDADVYPMLNKGSTAKPWEPYTGGQPSPSPDYPQEIYSAGDDGSIQVDVYGGNLLDANSIDTYSGNGITITNNGNGTFTFDGRSTAYTGKWAKIALPNGKYVANFIETNESGNVSYRGYYELNGYPTYLGDSTPFEITENTKEFQVFLGTQESDISFENFVFSPIIAAGEKLVPWEPYKHTSATLPTPNGLPGIPVDSGGNYTDAEGQQWICDEIDFKRGKYVQRVIKYTGPYRLMHWVASDSWFCAATQLENNPKPECMGFCNVSSIYNLSWINIGYSHWFLQSENQQIVIHLGDKYNTEEASQQFIAENEIVVYYVADTPIETDITPEQMAVYANLHTNRPTTVVSATDDVGLKLTYKTKKFLEVT